MIPHTTIVHECPAQINEAVMFKAIAGVEGGAWGKLGGPCCISLVAWSSHTSLPYIASAQWEFCEIVYHKHYEEIVEGLQRHHIGVTPATIYLVWRRGLRGALLRLNGDPIPEQCVRCENLYWDYLTNNGKVLTPAFSTNNPAAYLRH